MAASAGNRYAGMTWMRDLDIKMPADLAAGYAPRVRDALLYVASQQKRPGAAYEGLYRKLDDASGQIPIVCVQPQFEVLFLKARMRGTPGDRYFQLQLLDYCKAFQPNAIAEFPLSYVAESAAATAIGRGPPLGENSVEHSVCDQTHSPAASPAESGVLGTIATAELVEADALEYLTDAAALRSLLQRWCEFRRRLVERHTRKSLPAEVRVPDVSFALGHFLDGTLDQCTQGTRDGELHYIRAVLQLIQHTQGRHGAAGAEVQALVSEFAESLAWALGFIVRNVLCTADLGALPQGADVRDALSDVLDDAALLSNAVFWYECLRGLEALAPLLAQQPSFAQSFRDQDLPGLFRRGWTQLRATIRRTFFGVATDAAGDAVVGPLALRDFVPGRRLDAASKAVATGVDFRPLRFSPPLQWLLKAVPEFAAGCLPDPYGLARAVLAPDLLPTWCHPRLLEAFAQADSPIGILSLSPISGRTQAEEALIERARGFLMWPNTAWTAVQACMHMRQHPAALAFAAAQTAKLLGGAKGALGEWYALCQAKDGAPSSSSSLYAGGEAKQGWSATGLLLVAEAQQADMREARLRDTIREAPGYVGVLEPTRRAPWSAQVELTFYHAREFPTGIDPRLVSCAFLLPFTEPDADAAADGERRVGMGEHRLRGLDVAGGKLEPGETPVQAAYREGCQEELLLEGVRVEDLVLLGYEHGHELGPPRDPRYPHPDFFFLYYTVHGITPDQQARSLAPRAADSTEAVQRTRWLTRAQASASKWFSERPSVWTAANTRL